MDLSKYLKYLGGLVLLLLVFGSGWWVRDLGAQGELESLMKDHEIVLQEIETTKTAQVNSLTRALADSEANRDVLLDELASLRSKPAEIRYIVRTETVVEGGPTVVTTELPDSHLFEMENGLVVAEFRVKEGPEYEFETADLTLRADVVIGERDSAISLRAESNLDPDVEIEIPIEEFNVQHVREQRFFEPHVVIGANANVNGSGIGAGPSLGVSVMHLRGGLDLAHVRVNGSSSGQGLSIGVDPVLYNLGEPLPVFTNLWIGAGPTIDTNGNFGGSVFLGAKL